MPFNAQSPTPAGSFAVSGGSGGTTFTLGTTVPNITPSTVEFLQEMQWMDLDYYRVPLVGFSFWQNSGITVSLSGASPVEHFITQTAIICRVTAHYERKRIKHPFGPSATYIVSSQKFTVYPESGDHSNLSYGGTPVSTLGPRGTIRTTQKYIRTKNFSTSDTEVSQHIEGWTFELLDTTKDHISLMGDYRKTGFLNSFIPGNQLGIADDIGGIYTFIQKSGPYNYLQDRGADVITLINSVGQLISKEQIWQEAPLNALTTPATEYDIARHDFAPSV